MQRPALFILIVCLAITSRASAARSVHTLVFFGDSLTAGYGLDDPGTQSYPALIQAKIDAAGLPWRVVNAGVSGETSAGGRRRVDWVLRQPVDLFVLELGANDGLRGFPPAETRRNLQAIIDRVRHQYPAAIVVLAGMRMFPSMGEAYGRDFAATFSSLAAEDHLPLIPFLLEGVGGNPRLNQPDGLHPTAEGDAILAETVWRTVGPLLRGASPN